jgi:hypothetical protein
MRKRSLVNLRIKQALAFRNPDGGNPNDSHNSWGSRELVLPSHIADPALAVLGVERLFPSVGGVAYLEHGSNNSETLHTLKVGGGVLSVATTQFGRASARSRLEVVGQAWYDIGPTVTEFYRNGVPHQRLSTEADVNGYVTTAHHAAIVGKIGSLVWAVNNSAVVSIPKRTIG